MNEVFEILKNSFLIKNVVLNNFTILQKELNIEINITSEKYGNRKIFFLNVVKLDIDSDQYGASVASSIIIDDMSDMQWENVCYKVMISEDVMTFYCKEIIISPELKEK